MKILGSEISELVSYKISYKLLLDHIIQEKSPAYVTVNNVHTVTLALKDEYYRNIINNSLLSIPDGRPLSLIGKFKGKKINRIFGPEFFKRTLDFGQKDNLKHFLFGNKAETLEKLINNIRLKYPQAKIAGKIAPPFLKFSNDENLKFINEINLSGADIVWVSLGAPKQEKWIYENYLKINKGIMIGIGAGFDYLAGNIKDAPGWMKNYSLEWVYRLRQEPKRLWKRYAIYNSKFIFFVILDFLGLKRIK